MPRLECQKCGELVPLDEPIPRDSECASCRRDLRCCRNCRHYDAAYNNACRETMADPVEDKERRNFCEYFAFTRAAFVAAGKDSSRGSEARAKLESLFGGKGRVEGPADSGPSPGADRARDARAKLDALFRKPDPSDR